MRRKFDIVHTPRDFQREAVDSIKENIRTNPDQWHLYSSPTGTGKSIIQLTALDEIEDSILITPRLEIIAGMMEKVGERVDGLNDTELVNLSWKRYGIITPIRLRNILARGEMPFMPSVLLIDECHHDTARTYKDITMYLNGCPKVGLTATPYRGTPKGTKEFLSQWGDTINVVMQLADTTADDGSIIKGAVSRGFYQIPDTTIWPLLDDDMIDVANGEFKVSTVESKLEDSYDIIVSNCKPFYCQKMRVWDKPTIFSLPGQKAVNELHARFKRAGINTVVVTQDTKRVDRINAFTDVVTCHAALLQINVVSEGVDLPIRRVIDCSPTMSPVRWMQQVGRIRFGDDTPEYICCCRNLERHCYLWEGLLPNDKVAEAQQAFTDDEDKPIYSKRSGTRVVGLEGLGKFTTTPVHLLNGTIGFMYNLVSTANNIRTEYLCYIHPSHPEPIVGIKVSTSDGVKMSWGKWSLIESIPDLKGCQSVKVYALTEKQEKRWYADAERLGLNPHREVNTREFQILPFLNNTGLSFRS